MCAALTAVSNMTSTTIPCQPALHKNSVKTLPIFCYDYFENFLASTTFAKNFSCLARVVLKI